MDRNRSSGAGPAQYRIHVREHIDPRRAHWFAHLTITHAADCTTILAGELRDQAALYGALSRLRDLGLTLRAVIRPEADIDVS